MWLISLLPMRILYLISNLVFFIAYYLLRYRRKIVLNNLTKSFPEKSKKDIVEISRKFYKHFSHLLVEILKLTSISQKELESRIVYKNPEIIEDLYNKGKHVVLIAAHYGNWEWLNGLCRSVHHRILSVYKPLTNKPLNNLFIKMRSRFGAELVPMTGVMRSIARMKKENIPSAILLIADQSPLRHLIQYWTNFLNQDTPVFLGPAKIAIQTNQAVVFCKIMPTQPGYFEVEIIKLFEDASSANEIEITEAHTRLLEKIITEKPEYWLWSHRRWKHSRSQAEN